MEVPGGGALAVLARRGAHMVGERGQEVPAAERPGVAPGAPGDEGEQGGGAGVGLACRAVRVQVGVGVGPEEGEDLAQRRVLAPGGGERDRGLGRPGVVGALEGPVLHVVAADQSGGQPGGRGGGVAGAGRAGRARRRGRRDGGRSGRRGRGRRSGVPGPDRLRGEGRRPAGAADVGAPVDPGLHLPRLRLQRRGAELAVGPGLLARGSDPVRPVRRRLRGGGAGLLGRGRVLGAAVEGPDAQTADEGRAVVLGAGGGESRLVQQVHAGAGVGVAAADDTAAPVAEVDGDDRAGRRRAVLDRVRDRGPGVAEQHRTARRDRHRPGGQQGHDSPASVPRTTAADPHRLLPGRSTRVQRRSRQPPTDLGTAMTTS